jgi:hypothetical protein
MSGLGDALSDAEAAAARARAATDEARAATEASKRATGGGWFSQITPERVTGFLEPLTQAAQIYSAIRIEPYRQQIELAQLRREAQQKAAEELAKQQAAMQRPGTSKWTWAYIAVAGVLIVGGAYMLSKKK